ncbi:hypothetical protein [Bradyrhizobium sp. AZCC 1693]|uniref:hypothetical protein n=1 Tax=Bradyrhizobium sp. AZCC 1693 TaxID=3117029 RepID=UPI002FF353A9
MIDRHGEAISISLLGAAGALALSLAAFSAYGQQGSQAESIAAWNQIVTVLQHPRCLNCHQQNVPLQGDMRRIHIPLVVRGSDSHGVGAMRCGNCHNGSGNSETSGTPGAGGAGLWQLAPLSMLWEGLSSSDLCRMLKDKARNGARDGAALVHHMEHEPLVLWGWNPGGDRAPVSLPHDEFVKQMKLWVAGGMPCPG